MDEYQRLIRELQAAVTIEQAHVALRMSLTSGLTQEQKAALIQFVPAHLRKPTNPQHLLSVIRTLEALNVWSGRATSWSRERWRDNPWQLIQVSAARAILACRPMFTATDWGAMAKAAHCLAVHGRPSQAWPRLLETLQQYPPKSAYFAAQVAARMLFTAWTTQNDRREESADLRRWIRVVMKVEEPALPARMLDRLGDEAQAFVGLAPESAVARMEELDWACAAMLEVVAALAVHRHLRNQPEAEAWLNRMLANES